jgi:hypothetical protein
VFLRNHPHVSRRRLHVVAAHRRSRHLLSWRHLVSGRRKIPLADGAQVYPVTLDTVDQPELEGVLADAEPRLGHPADSPKAAAIGAIHLHAFTESGFVDHDSSFGAALHPKRRVPPHRSTHASPFTGKAQTSPATGEETIAVDKAIPRKLRATLHRQSTSWSAPTLARRYQGTSGD